MAVFYKYQYTNKRKNIHPCILDRLILAIMSLYIFVKGSVTVQCSVHALLSLGPSQRFLHLWNKNKPEV